MTNTTHSHPSTLRGRQLLLLLLLCLSIWFFGIAPMRSLHNAEQLKKQHRRDTYPITSLLQRLPHYLNARATLLWRVKATALLTKDVAQTIHPSSIARSFRSIHQHGTLTQWNQLRKQWNTDLIRLQRQLPFLPLRYLHTFLKLYTGHWQLTPNPPTSLPPKNRQDTLHHIWSGHMAFWSGHPKRAMAHYNNALSAFHAHPLWLKTSPQNWRLPTESLTTHYHVGLLLLLQKKPQPALKHFLTIAKQRTHKITRSERDNLRYASMLWAAEAAHRNQQPKQALKWLRQAGLFPKDPTLQQLAMASLLKNSQPRTSLAWLQRAILSIYPQIHSYTDSHLLARLQRAIFWFEKGNPHQAIRSLKILQKILQKRRWPLTTRELTAKNTRRLRFFPAPPHTLKRLLQHLHKLKPQPTSQPTTQPTSRPTHTHTHTAHPHPPHRPADMLEQWHLRYAMSLLRLHQWTQAQTQLKSMLDRPSVALTARWFLALLAIKQNQPQQALSLLQHPAHPPAHWKLAIAYTHTLLGDLKNARTQLHKKTRSKRWDKATTQLNKLLTSTLPKRHKKANFWRWNWGPKGFLHTHDPLLTRLSRSWQLHPLTWKKHNATWEILRSLSVSHKPDGRFGLLTLLAKADALQLYYAHHKQPTQARQFQRQKAFLTRIYRTFPQQQYLLDQLLYSHYWGMIVLQLD